MELITISPQAAHYQVTQWTAAGNLPRLVQLAYSGGKASECVLEMVLRRELVVPVPLIVTCADPGMEDPRTHNHTNAMEARCHRANIPFLRAKRNLYQELLAAKRSGATRFDFPGFYTKDRVTGKRGKMLQKCTQAYKIAPMDRLARSWMDANMGISKRSKRIGERILCKWVGFSASEFMRVKNHPVPKYVYFDYPLINLGMNDLDILKYYADRSLRVPPRSVCAGCFANDAWYFEEMYNERPESWAQAVAVDEEIRDLSQFGVRDECFVYQGLLPLRELAAQGFPKPAKKERTNCHTGHCFL